MDSEETKTATGKGPAHENPVLPDAAPPIRDAYRRRTPASAARLRRAERSMPGGSTRAFGYFSPHPVAFTRAEGPKLWDVNGNEYLDLIGNGMSLIHGHAYQPIVEALERELGTGSVWPGSSIPQIELAELLADRVPGDNLVRFVSTGTEATMLALKLARKSTGRELVVKARGGYHGSADELEAGLYGKGEVPGRMLLARFNDVASFERVFAQHGDRIAAVIIESVMLTGRVVVPDPGFLLALREMARRAGALFVLDDCVLFRLALGGSGERFGLDADLTCLGKWIGGGLPLGAVAGRASLMEEFDLRRAGALQHSGSFNGNRLSCAAGEVAVNHLTGERIDRMDAQAAWLAETVGAAAQEMGLPLRPSVEGSVVGLTMVDPATDESDPEAGASFHVAALNHGVYLGTGGETSLSTCFGEEELQRAAEGLVRALEDVRSNSRELEVER